MILVPVIDLKDGLAVQAHGGARDRYQPVDSTLCRGSDPADVVHGYLGLHPFTTLYVADLDAIEGNGDNHSVIRRLGILFPDLDLWVDSGLTGRTACLNWLATGDGTLVLGSESQKDHGTLTGLLNSPHAGRLILSLDFRGQAFLGPAGLADQPEFWPDRVIAMTLTRIGGDQGPDMDRLERLMAAAPSKRFFAAGGVRNPDDLMRLAALGASGALLASALHDGRIGRPDIARTCNA